eukprot:scaffold223372_cov32-Tisochrysis_lutea.AAC.1
MTEQLGLGASGDQKIPSGEGEEGHSSQGIDRVPGTTRQRRVGSINSLITPPTRPVGSPAAILTSSPAS